MNHPRTVHHWDYLIFYLRMKSSASLSSLVINDIVFADFSRPLALFSLKVIECKITLGVTFNPILFSLTVCIPISVVARSCLSCLALSGRDKIASIIGVFLSRAFKKTKGRGLLFVALILECDL